MPLIAAHFSQGTLSIFSFFEEFFFNNKKLNKYAKKFNRDLLKQQHIDEQNTHSLHARVLFPNMLSTLAARKQSFHMQYIYYSLISVTF